MCVCVCVCGEKNIELLFKQFVFNFVCLLLSYQ